MMKKKKILVLIESLSGGGAEKVLSTVVRYINQEYCNIMVCVLSGGGVYEKDIAGHVDIHVVLKNEASYKGLWKIWYKFMYYLVYCWLPSWLVYMLFIPRGMMWKWLLWKGMQPNCWLHLITSELRK